MEASLDRYIVESRYLPIEGGRMEKKEQKTATNDTNDKRSVHPYVEDGSFLFLETSLHTALSLDIT